eukprot:6185770-Pleurochrysis_carterae.AAC.1
MSAGRWSCESLEVGTRYNRYAAPRRVTRRKHHSASKHDKHRTPMSELFTSGLLMQMTAAIRQGDEEWDNLMRDTAHILML